MAELICFKMFIVSFAFSIKQNAFGIEIITLSFIFTGFA